MGNLKLTVFLAYKSIIKGSRWTLALMILVMSLSFANLVLTPSIMSGVTAAINQEQINTLYGNILIDPPANQPYLSQVNQIENQVKQNPGVAGVSAHLNSKALFEYTGQRTSSSQSKVSSGTWNIIGISPQQESTVTTIHDSLISGSYLAPGDTGQIVLGVEIAGGTEAQSQPFLNLGGVKVGDRISLTFPNGTQSEFTVKGIFKVRNEFANNLAYINMPDFTTASGSNVTIDNANQILIRTQPGNNDDQILNQLKASGIDGQVRSWLDYGGGVGGIISSFGVIASIIGGIGLIVAGVVLFIVIYISVASRKRQIGILRAIGIHRNVVLGSYLIQALLYAVLGIILGGLMFGYIIKPFFDANPIDLPIGLVSPAIDMSTIRNAIIGLLIAAVLAGIIPVLNITRHSIIKAIWGN